MDVPSLTHLCLLKVSHYIDYMPNLTHCGIPVNYRYHILNHARANNNLDTNNFHKLFNDDFHVVALNGCWNVESSVEELARTCSRITHLNLNGAVNIRTAAPKEAKEEGKGEETKRNEEKVEENEEKEKVSSQVETVVGKEQKVEEEKEAHEVIEEKEEQTVQGQQKEKAAAEEPEGLIKNGDIFNISSFSHLTYLAVAGCKLLTSSSLLSIISISHTTLTHLDLSFCIDTVTDSFLSQLPPLPNLRVAILSKCSHLTDASTVAFTTVNTKLQQLQLSSCYHCTDLTVRAAASSCLGLELLDISRCWRMKLDTPLCSDDTTYFTSLTHLNISKDWKVSSAHLTRYTTKLTFLDISGVTGIVVSDLQQILATNTGLQTLRLAGLRDLPDSVFDFIPPRLTTLVLTGSTLFSGNSVLTNIVSKCGDTLQKLALPGSNLFTQYRLSCICRCPNLTALSLSNFRSLSDELLEQVGKEIGQNITSLDISKSGIAESKIFKDVPVTQAGFSAISQYFPNLRNLVLTKRDISDKSFTNLVRNCTRLTSLDVTSCGRLSENSMWELGRACTNLQIAKLGNCPTMGGSLGVVARARV